MPDRAKKADRYLIKRDGRFIYRRRVPTSLADVDERSPFVRLALKTSDERVARAKRDVLEEADDLYWAQLTMRSDEEKARMRYEAAKRRAEALGFVYKTAIEIAKLPVDDIIDRIDTANTKRQNDLATDAVLGVAEQPTVKISTAEKTYFNEIVQNQISRKSPQQRNHWLTERKASFNCLIEQIGNKDINSVTREDALAFYRYLNKTVGAKERTASWGNHQLGRVRKFFNEYFNYIGVADYNNPFAGLSFKDFTVSRPPFSVAWIQQKILAPGALSGLNEEARHILLTLIDTGARMGEICNLSGENIHLDSEYPFIEIKPRLDPNNPREIKTRSSIRSIPLIGLAFAAVSKHPDGFFRYRDKETTLSNTLNKYFRENKLFETDKHVIYSFRHAFEDRMKVANLDSELRRSLMGHTIDRPKYGSGGSMKWRWEQLKKIEMPFDLSIV